MKYCLRFKSKKEAVVTLLKLFAGSIGEYCLIDTWNAYCYETDRPQKDQIFWTEMIYGWFSDKDPEKIIENARKLKDINPNHEYFKETEDGFKSTNSPANEGWIDYDVLADWLIDNPDELAEFPMYEERNE